MTIHQLPHLDIPTSATPLVIFTIISYVICTSAPHLISVSSDLLLSTLYPFALVCFVPISLAPVFVSLITAYTAFILYFRPGFVVGPTGTCGMVHTASIASSVRLSAHLFCVALSLPHCIFAIAVLPYASTLLVPPPQLLSCLPISGTFGPSSPCFTDPSHQHSTIDLYHIIPSSF